MVSAVCPKCTIYLVEANSDYTSDMQTAEQNAVALGAHIISDSWGCNESSSCADPSYFYTKGVLYVASAGDNGYPEAEAPAAFPTVVSVGGTELSKSGSKYSETVWPGTGSGCAYGIAKLPWQKNICGYRAQNDVSAVAANVAEYDSYEYGGWITNAGTSVSAPLIAGVYALAENATSLDGARKFYVQSAMQYKRDMHDITTGSNGHPCHGNILCEARKGWDGPTGWGTPNTTKAF
jgi:subtilase family serine protease